MTEYEAISKLHPNWHIPEFDADILASKKNRYALIVFVINEGEKIRKQLKVMKAFDSHLDLIIADGGSTDGSLDAPYLKANDVRALLTKRGPGKLSSQMRMAFAWALTQKYDGIVVVDGNGKDDLSAIPAFIERLEAGYDHVQGSRFIRGGKAINTPISRLVGVRLIHSPMISAAARHRHTDTTNGFRAYSARLLGDERLAIFRDIFQTYELHYYLAIQAARKGFRLCEIPVTRAYPKYGKVPTKISPVKGNLHVLKVLGSACVGKYDVKGSK